MAVFEVSDYVVHLGAALSADWQGTRFTYQGRISCRGAEHHRLVLYFLADGTLPRPDVDLPEAKFGRMRLPLSHMPLFLDMLRHEKPVFGHLHEAQPDQIRLSTVAEPVEEGTEDP